MLLIVSPCIPIAITAWNGVLYRWKESCGSGQSLLKLGYSLIAVQFLSYIYCRSSPPYVLYPCIYFLTKFFWSHLLYKFSASLSTLLISPAAFQSSVYFAILTCVAFDTFDHLYLKLCPFLSFVIFSDYGLFSLLLHSLTSKSQVCIPLLEFLSFCSCYLPLSFIYHFHEIDSWISSHAFFSCLQKCI